MDKQTYILARNFFRSEIKTLSERLKHNKHAYRENQRIASKVLEVPLVKYIDVEQSWLIYWRIACDKLDVTALHIAYAKLRGKQHVRDENAYIETLEGINKRMEEYLAKEQITSPEAVAVGG